MRISDIEYTDQDINLRLLRIVHIRRKLVIKLKSESLSLGIFSSQFIRLDKLETIYFNQYEFMRAL